MRRWALGAALAGLAAGAQAQGLSTALEASRDSDDFRETSASAGYRGASGFGLKATSLHYRAPGWSENGASLAATYQHRGDDRQLDASVGVLRLAGRDHAVGTLELMQPVAAATSLGLSLERDVVDSVAGIEAGTTSNSIALVADHAFGARFNVGLAAGVTRFSNDNRRPFLRTRWNLELVPAHGLNAYLKTRSAQNSTPNRPEYYSPERLSEVSLGLSARTLIAEGVVLGAAADAGTQHTEAGSQRIWSTAVRLASPRAAALQWSIALQATNAAGTSQATGSSSYRYTSAVAQLNIPF
jgi:hypothetical protein